jgi:DNA-binding transcriptional LysR family regulator
MDGRMIRLNQRQIEVFNAIMIHKGVTAAAVALRTSQPTVSRELREMETYIGFDLFHRFGKRLTPTAQAQLLHDVVKRSFVGMDEISRAAIAIGGYNAAHLRIACIPAYAEAFIPLVAKRFMEIRPTAHLVVHSLEESLLHHDLTSQMFDIGLTEGTYEYEGVATQQLDIGEVLCALPAGHRLCAKAVLDPQDFEGVEFVYFSQDDPYRRKLDAIFDAAGVSRRYTVETTTATGVCSMVAAGIGVSIVNPLTAAHYAKRGIELRRMSVRVPYRINLWRPAKGPRSPLADQFILSLREVASEISSTLP